MEKRKGTALLEPLTALLAPTTSKANTSVEEDDDDDDDDDDITSIATESVAPTWLEDAARSRPCLGACIPVAVAVAVAPSSRLAEVRSSRRAIIFSTSRPMRANTSD